MLHPREALERILARVATLDATERVPLAAAAGRALAQEVVSDVDLPPFEKSMMDGYALRSAELGAGGTLLLAGESRAGAPFEGPLPPGACVAIYTGAELPAGCDAVEMVERTRREGERVRFEGPLAPGRNVSHRGEILRRGGRVLAPPRRLSALDLSVLASAGQDPVLVRRRPRVSVLTAGDELVPSDRVPGPGQIREGNTLFLAAACEAAGAQVLRAGILPDREDALVEAFGAALERGDALVTSGGVSVGKYDLVGAAFEKVGVEPVLHKVAIKPGKPIWFGMRGAQPVFGLPGNPVSSLLGFEVFVRPALAKLAGFEAEACRARLSLGRWSGAATSSAGREDNLPVRVRQEEDGVFQLEPLAYRGSADHVAVAEADGFAVVPADRTIQPGELVHFRPLFRPARDA